MAAITLHQLIEQDQYDGALVYYAKRRDINGMAERMADGACPSSLLNVLHYFPRYFSDALEATDQLSDSQQEYALEILGAIDERLNIGKRDLVMVWKCRNAARSALNSIIHAVVI